MDLILGLNGYIWVSKHVKENEQEGEEGFDSEAVYSNKNDVSPFSAIASHFGFITNLFIGMTRISMTRLGQRFRGSRTLFVS